jgi:hypothetical protein
MILDLLLVLRDARTSKICKKPDDATSKVAEFAPPPLLSFASIDLWMSFNHPESIRLLYCIPLLELEEKYLRIAQSSIFLRRTLNEQAMDPSKLERQKAAKMRQRSRAVLAWTRNTDAGDQRDADDDDSHWSLDDKVEVVCPPNETDGTHTPNEEILEDRPPKPQRAISLLATQVLNLTRRIGDDEVLKTEELEPNKKTKVEVVCPPNETDGTHTPNEEILEDRPPKPQRAISLSATQVLNLTRRIGDDEVLKMEELELAPNNCIVIPNMVPPTSPNGGDDIVMVQPPELQGSQGNQRKGQK